MQNTYRIVLAVLACVAIAVADPIKGKMRDPRDGKMYRTISFNRPDDELWTWMTEPLGGDTAHYMYKDVGIVCPDGWRLPTLMESLFLIDVLEGEKTEIYSSSFKFSVDLQNAKKYDLLSNIFFVTSDGYAVAIEIDPEKSKMGEITIFNIEYFSRMMMRFFSKITQKPEMIPERFAQSVDETPFQVHCVKRTELRKK